MIENNIKQLRTKKQVTQAALAQACSVSRQTVIGIEKGQYIPSLKLAIAIAAFFKMPVEKIFLTHS